MPENNPHPLDPLLNSSLEEFEAFCQNLMDEYCVKHGDGIDIGPVDASVHEANDKLADGMMN